MADRSTNFLFDHKVFAVDGALFALASDGVEPLFHVPLGGMTGALPLPALRHEFAIAPQSADARLLEIVEKGLRFVHEIRPGDSIPSELLDGTASWRVEERHRLRARGRMMAQLIAWTAGEGVMAVDDGAFEALAANPHAVNLVNPAAAAMAGAGVRGISSAAQVLHRLERLAREYAYIEALRERFGLVRAMVPKINQLIHVYRNDRNVKDELARVRTLILRPLDENDKLFAAIAGKPQDMPEWLGVCDIQIDHLREARDELHVRLMGWDKPIEQWAELAPVRSPEAEAAVNALYRCLARQYTTQQAW